MFRRGIPILIALLAPLAQAAPLDDPMRPPGAPLNVSPSGGKGDGVVGGLSGYHLSSTIVDGDRRLAVINGRRYAEGERVGAARIERIMLTKVVLRLPGGTRTVHLLPRRSPAIKRPSGQ